ncbi:disulfide bond formation protein DsbA [Kaistia algarum]|uniref:DsbA family protein n=1 Tax=Kaistia algarum TaxID=2083279 RepID=UPI000CE79374|nr:DsbA family protein [Kaistia algarum]MCX5515200.1 DsbA family protein [Kaistia algarum]PPE80013.1 disulfide bond formation protein DsbA [Kaistia algarum]
MQNGLLSIGKKAGLVLVAATMMLGLAVPAMAASPLFDQAQKDEIGAIVKDYLMQHPEVIRDAMQELDKRQQAAAAETQKSNVAKQADLLFNSKRQVVLGNPDGDVTLVEFFDYNCGYCKRAHADMAKLMDEDKNLRVVLKEFPVLGPGSEEAAQVAVIVNEMAPEKYRAFHDELLLSRGEVNGARALAVAGDVGLDTAAIKARLKEPEIGATINESYTLAQSLGINGTPSYVVKDEVVVGAVGYDTLKGKIESVRACGSTSC